MKLHKFLQVFLAAASVLLIAIPGCITDPKESPIRKDRSESSAYEYCDLREKEDVITNLLLSYKDLNIDRFAELLHPDYIFVLQPGDIKGNKDHYTREEDIRITEKMFCARMGECSPKIRRLELNISEGTEGSWHAAEEIDGKPCPGCWLTERNYRISVDLGFRTYHGDDMVLIYVAPVEEEGVTRYKIRIIYDVSDD